MFLGKDSVLLSDMNNRISYDVIPINRSNKDFTKPMNNEKNVQKENIVDPNLRKSNTPSHKPHTIVSNLKEPYTKPGKSAFTSDTSSSDSNRPPSTSEIKSEGILLLK